MKEHSYHRANGQRTRVPAKFIKRGAVSAALLLALTGASALAETVPVKHAYKAIPKVVVLGMPGVSVLREPAAGSPEAGSVGDGAGVTGTADFFGTEFSLDATVLTLDNRELTDAEFASIPEVIRPFTKLEKLELLHTGRSNEELAALNEQLGNIRVVWTVKLGKKWELRTDTVYFSTKHSPQASHKKTRLTTKDIQVLQYCTDLEGLDLGHHSIDDISVLANLKKLRVLIVIDNRVSDLSPLAELKELEYLELFLLRVTDVSPLANHPKLKHLNLAHNRLSKADLSPLYTDTALERLWVNSCALTKDQQAALKEALPNCQMEFKEYDSTGAGWREHPYYQYLREIFQYD